MTTHPTDRARLENGLLLAHDRGRLCGTAHVAAMTTGPGSATAAAPAGAQAPIQGRPQAGPPSWRPPVSPPQDWPRPAGRACAWSAHANRCTARGASLDRTCSGPGRPDGAGTWCAARPTRWPDRRTIPNRWPEPAGTALPGQVRTRPPPRRPPTGAAATAGPGTSAPAAAPARPHRHPQAGRGAWPVAQRGRTRCPGWGPAQSSARCRARRCRIRASRRTGG
jgi:hypothetical protein